MLDEARYWAETQFGTADLGDARRTHRLVSIMAAIARAPDESLPRQLGSLANTKAGYRLFDCGAVTRTAVMNPHVAHCHAAAARHPIVLMVHESVQNAGWDAVVRAARERRLVLRPSMSVIR